MSANFADMEFVTLAKDGTEGYFPEIWVKKCFLCFEVLKKFSESFFDPKIASNGKVKRKY